MCGCRSQPDRGTSYSHSKAAGRLGRNIVADFRDEGISGARDRDKRPELEVLPKGNAGYGGPTAQSHVCKPIAIDCPAPIDNPPIAR